MRRTGIVVLVVAAGLAGGCGGGDAAGISAADSAFVGEYALGNVNGQRLPFKLPFNATFATWTMLVDSARITVGADYAFHDDRHLTIRPAAGDPFPRTERDSGTWRALPGDHLEFTYRGQVPAVVDTLDILGTLLVRASPGASYLYSR